MPWQGRYDWTVPTTRGSGSPPGPPPRTVTGPDGTDPTAGRYCEIAPSARRILDRLTEVPTCLCDAAWNVLTGYRRWSAGFQL